MAGSIPEHWAQAMTKAGFLDARFGNPSMSELARAAGVHTSTVSNMVLRGKLVSPRNLVAIADALGVPTAEVTRWVTGEIVDPYIPPAGSENLTYRERAALNELILTMIEKKAGSDDHDDDPDDQKKTGPGPSLPGETARVRRHRTPFEQEQGEAYGLAARFNTEHTDR